MSTKKNIVSLALVVCALGFVKTSYALPFNQDMVNHQAITGKVMRPAPENSIAIGSLDRQIKDEEQIKDWKNPYEGNEESIQKGKRYFAVNCSPCHGTFKDGKHVPSYIQDKGMPSIDLSDESIIYNDPGTRKNPKLDSHYFNYIYNGGVLMPPYGYKLSNEEIWHVVSYIRSVQAGTKAALGAK